LASAEKSQYFEGSLACAENSHNFENRELVRVRGYRSRISGAEPSVEPLAESLAEPSVDTTPVECVRSSSHNLSTAQYPSIVDSPSRLHAFDKMNMMDRVVSGKLRSPNEHSSWSPLRIDLCHLFVTCVIDATDVEREGDA
jgi:hypothetical protein